MKSLNKVILIFIICIIQSSFANEKNELLFTIKDHAFTIKDLEKRKDYLLLFYGTPQTNIEDEVYLNDLIAVNIFNLHAKEYNIQINEDLINDYLNDVIIRYERRESTKFEHSNFFEELSNKFIKKNIKYDLQRKTILESLLKKNKILTEDDNINELLKIFNVNLNYLIIENKDKIKFDNIVNIESLMNIKDIIKVLNANSINFELYNKKITNFETLDIEIKENILNNYNKFLISKDEYFIFAIVKKIINKNIDLKYSFYQIKFEDNEEIKNLNIQCNNISNLKKINNIKVNQFKEIEIEKLNINILQKLIKKNDYILIEDNNQKSLLLLCNIEYNYELAEDMIRQSKIQKIADKLELEFVNLKKKEYKFILY